MSSSRATMRRPRRRVEAFVESLGLRPLDVGGLKAAHWLEVASLVEMGLARHGVGHSNSPSASPIPAR